MEYTTKEMSYDASSGEGRIFARGFAPADKNAVRGILQIAHGMAEHSLRYESFAKYLVAKGFVVCVNDHAGHGKSAVDEESFGYFGPGGYQNLVKDMNKLRRIIQEDFPSAPYMLMGHSMGSFLARRYLSDYGEGVSAAVLCGTSAGFSPAVMKMGLAYANRIVMKKGPKAHDDHLKKLTTGGYNRSFQPARTENDWLSRDEAQVDLYNQDPLCGFDFTVSGYRDLVTLLFDVNKPQWFRSVPTDFPILMVSGDQDPVGDFGKGVRKVYHRLVKTGHDVKLILYPGGRHEILNETNREQVYEDIASFLLKATD